MYYISVKVEPLQYSYRKILDNKVGSKSVAVYKSLKSMRNERIDELLKKKLKKCSKISKGR